jgi:phosphoglycolate phosphatase
MDQSLVLFDLDGTIIDSAPGIVAGMRRAFAEVGEDVPPDDVLRSWIGPPVLRTLERELGEQGADVVARANTAFRGYFDTVGAHETETFPGMQRVIEMLDMDDAAIVVVTHKPLPLAELALAEHQLAELVRAIHAPPTPGTWVPKEKLFAAALAATRAHAVVAAGDRAGDVHAAAAHGVPTVGVTWGYGTVDELEAAGAAALAADADELLAALQNVAAPRP